MLSVEVHLKSRVTDLTKVYPFSVTMSRTKTEEVEELDDYESNFDLDDNATNDTDTQSEELSEDEILVEEEDFSTVEDEDTSANEFEFEFEGAQELRDQAEAVLEIDDETDLEEAAKFDLSEFMKSQGVDLGTGGQPNVIVQNNLKEKFAIPTNIKASRNGKMNFKFSSNIVIPDFVALLKSFKKDEEETRVL